MTVPRCGDRSPVAHEFELVAIGPDAYRGFGGPRVRACRHCGVLEVSINTGPDVDPLLVFYYRPATV